VLERHALGRSLVATSPSAEAASHFDIIDHGSAPEPDGTVARVATLHGSAATFLWGEPMVRTSRWLSGIVASALLASSACGGGGESDATSSASKFCAALNSKWAKRGSCARASPEAIADSEAYSSVGCASYDEAVSAGRARFDSGEAARCLDAVDAVGCGGPAAYVSEPGTILVVFPGPISACQSVVVGQVALGGSCSSLLDCAAGFCDRSTTCPGTCVPYREVGESCGDAVIIDSPGPAPAKVCSPGLACAWTGAVTGSPVCRALAALDGPCPCQPDLYCDSASSTCKVPMTSGACASVTECAVGYQCTSSGCRLAGVLGDACDPAPAVPLPWKGFDCAPGYACDPASRKCIAALRDGQSCLMQLDGASYYLACLHGTRFTAEGGCTCIPPPKADGVPCTADGECLGTCDPVRRKCTSSAGACS
jgi:hypothetical protein